ncbi:outer membrane receptor for ferrienterochelin and colicins [Catalinimonas alkaloidigena]|uniref:TonB-dependent receptor n=1 Tax=Catalinimonas alkaloidigena TaxID=1075417 RepID=UPI002405DC95|nr:TonB-dependent receptor [Catalinimonas alkaloidigena]MDF9795449.1 outer membrane receptor for ferrienterochelin and colicins [Catalinimonas alkaloidigena]
MKTLFTIISLSLSTIYAVYGQAEGRIAGKITADEQSIPFANVEILGTKQGASANGEGYFVLQNLEAGTYQLRASSVGYEALTKSINLKEGQKLTVNFNLSEVADALEEVVITGTLKEVNRLESAVPVEVYNPTFFKKNPTPTIYDALQNVNGVRPQLNCNVCNTGDIHINGLEGPYTMILIDGMPIVSGLASVYGLFGIPNSMIRRIEIVKGPASSLYGSEAVGGLINIITKDPKNALPLSIDVMSTSWQEYNIDVGHRLKLGDKVSVLTGVNYFNYNKSIDNNNDGFTDVTLQDRLSIFQKWNFERKDNRLFSLAGRYLYEDRWGGEMNWAPDYRGGDEVYGESIYTKRWELIGNYQLPVQEEMLFTFSYNAHNQNSYYGDVPYMADQKIAFGQLTWDKNVKSHDLLLGSALRYTYYDDNTPATASEDRNLADETWLPGLFVQDDISLTDRQRLLLGMRYDYNSNHGSIFTPRLAYKITLDDNNILRLNAGTGFRVVNLFTEEHAALTGSREVVIAEALHPEQSYNLNLNYIKKMYLREGSYIGLDATAWHTYFTNQILPDYDTDPNQIIYRNLDAYAVTQGISVNLDTEFANGINVLAGGSFMNVFFAEEDAEGKLEKRRPVLTERWTGTWAVSYTIDKLNLGIDYTGNLYGPMRLPLLSDLDPRDEMSPWWSLQNIQLSWAQSGGSWEIYGGVKNLLNFTPPANSIARPDDPFDREVTFGEGGEVVPTPNNPYGLTFDPAYVYAPNQGIRGFLGVRYVIQ